MKLVLDGRPNSKPNKCFVWGKNMMYDKHGTSIKNENGFSIHYTESNGYYIIGIIPTPECYIVFSTNKTTKDGTGYSKIVKVEYDGTTTTLVNSSYLDFTIYTSIKGSYSHNLYNELVIVFWSGLNEIDIRPYYLNIDNIPDISTQTKSELIRMFPYLDIPVIELSSISDGGSIPQGSYSFALSYIMGNDESLRVGELCGPINIFQPDTSGDWEDYQLKDNANKIINFQLTNVSTIFNKIRLYAIKRTSTEIIAYKIQDFSITGSTLSVSFNGRYDNIVATEEVVIPNAAFTRINAGTIFNNELDIGGVKYNNYDYQPYATAIAVSYALQEVTERSGSIRLNTEAAQIYRRKGVTPNEVYALYVHLKFKDGTITKGAHIPGRVVGVYEEEDGEDVQEDELLTNYTTGNYASANYPALTEEQGIAANLKIFHTRDTSKTDGTLGFWENEDELYPSDNSSFDGSAISGGVDLQGDKVRHHRMPGYRRISAVGESTAMKYTVYLKFTNVIIPTEIEDEVDRVIFSYAKRTSLNSLILGIAPTIPNDAYTILDTSAPTSSSSKELRFPNPNLVINKFSISPTYLHHFRSVQANLNADGSMIHGHDFDGGTVVETSINTGCYEQVDSIEYLQEDNAAQSNTDKEANLLVTTVNTPSSKFGTVNNPYDEIRIFLGELRNSYKNTYLNFNSQQLAFTHKIHSIVASTSYYSVFGFDNFHNGHVYGRSAYGASGYLAWYGQLNSGMDVDATYEDAVNPPTKKTFWRHLYDPIFSSVNDLKSGLPLNYNLQVTTEEKFTIYRSDTQATESTIMAFRRFAANSYYILKNKAKGEIINLFASYDDIIIQRKYSLYVAKLRDKLLSNYGDGAVTETFLGQVDIFERDPDEILHDDLGNIGCQSRFAGIFTEFGYVTVDAQKGEVSLYNKQTRVKLSDDGVSTFLRNYLPDILDHSSAQYDQPHYYYGILLGYDSYNKVLYLTMKTTSSYNFTLSYSFSQKAWVTFHDWIPNQMFTSRDSMYLVHNNHSGSDKGYVYVNNTSTKGLYFKEPTGSRLYQDSYIDILFNDPKAINKVLKSLTIKSDCTTKNANGEIRFKDKPISSIMIYNDNQCSGIIPITYSSTFLSEGNIRKVGDRWYINKFSDAVKDRSLPILYTETALVGGQFMQPIASNVDDSAFEWYEKLPFTGTYIVVRLIWENDNNDYDLYLTDIEPSFKINQR